MASTATALTCPDCGAPVGISARRSFRNGLRPAVSTITSQVRDPSVKSWRV